MRKRHLEDEDYGCGPAGGGGGIECGIPGRKEMLSRLEEQQTSCLNQNIVFSIKHKGH